MEKNQSLPACCVVKTNTKKDYIEIGAIFLLLVAGYLLLKQFNLLPKGLGITDNMGYGFVLLIGLLSSVSTCMAVTGGLLLSLSTKYNLGWQSNLSFNLGRVISYAFFGGAIGALGSFISLSSTINGAVMIVASLLMVGMGLQMLNLWPKALKIQWRLPGLDRWFEKYASEAPFMIGFLTFFLPCGFTQALQLYVLSRGDFTVGALTMLAFSLGTLPSLLAIGWASKFSKNSSRFMKFIGALVIVLGVSNVTGGLNLVSLDLTADVSTALQQVNYVPEENGKQIAKMKVVGLDYVPASFTVKTGVPVEWQIDGSQAQGCAQFLQLPKLSIRERLLPGKTNVFTFTPQEKGTYKFTCNMGMTSGKFIVN